MAPPRYVRRSGKVRAKVSKWIVHRSILTDARRSPACDAVSSSPREPRAAPAANTYHCTLQHHGIGSVRPSNSISISIGGGSGGLACAQRAAEYGARTAVIEPKRLGGTCVNVGCVPKKIMWNASSVALSLQDAEDYGFDVKAAASDWAELKRKRDAYVLRLNGIYERNLAAKGVAYVRGAARFIDAHSVEVNGRRFSARHVVIATGGKPTLPGIPGAQLGISSDGFFELETLPKRVAVIGSGYIACELAASFLELGSDVEQFIRTDRLLSNFDVMLGKSLKREVRALGMIIQRARGDRGGARGCEARKRSLRKTAASLPGFDGLLWAIGRDANVAGLDLQAAGVAHR